MQLGRVLFCKKREGKCMEECKVNFIVFRQSVVAEVHVRPRSSLGSSSSVFTSPPPLSGTKTAHAEDVNRRTLSSAAALSVASIGAESANTSTTTRQAFSVDLPTTEKMPSAVLRMAHPKTAHLTPLDIRTAPIAQTDTDLYMSSSCSSLDVSKAPGSSRQLSETLAHSCTLPNGTEMRWGTAQCCICASYRASVHFTGICLPYDLWQIRNWGFPEKSRFSFRRNKSITVDDEECCQILLHTWLP